MIEYTLSKALGVTAFLKLFIKENGADCFNISANLKTSDANCWSVFTSGYILFILSKTFKYYSLVVSPAKVDGTITLLCS